MAARPGNNWSANRRIGALERFAMKCAFDPYTGCVMWIGGTTTGHGNRAPYGSFWDAGQRWFAHRWAAHHIHGLDIDGLPVGHCCPAGPSTLCVEHLKGMTRAENQEMIKTHPGRGEQDLATKQYWLLVSKGVERFEEVERALPDMPFFEPPTWLRPFLIREASDDCPF